MTTTSAAAIRIARDPVACAMPLVLLATLDQLNRSYPGTALSTQILLPIQGLWGDEGRVYVTPLVGGASGQYRLQSVAVTVDPPAEPPPDGVTSRAALIRWLRLLLAGRNAAVFDFVVPVLGAGGRVIEVAIGEVARALADPASFANQFAEQDRPVLTGLVIAVDALGLLASPLALEHRGQFEQALGDPLFSARAMCGMAS